jgi:cytochrome bd-type quinol oxidase subunit 1
MINILQRWFIDPCKKCLVKPCCIKKCEPCIEHIELHDNFCLIIGFSIVLTVLIAIGFVLYSFDYMLIGCIVWLVCVIWIYICYLADNTTLHQWYDPAIMIIMPYIFLALLLGVTLIEIRKIIKRR